MTAFATVYPGTPVTEKSRWPAIALQLLTDDELQQTVRSVATVIAEYEHAMRPLRFVLMEIREEQSRRKPAEAL
jgi:hypothetical protein